MKRLLAVLLASLPAVAQEIPDPPAGFYAPPPGHAFCYPKRGYCVVTLADYVESSRCVNESPAIIAELAKRAGTVQCASLTVTEPSRTFTR